jgi:hypothetical protein
MLSVSTSATGFRPPTPVNPTAGREIDAQHPEPRPYQSFRRSVDGHTRDDIGDHIGGPRVLTVTSDRDAASPLLKRGSDLIADSARTVYWPVADVCARRRACSGCRGDGAECQGLVVSALPGHRRVDETPHRAPRSRRSAPGCRSTCSPPTAQMRAVRSIGAGAVPACSRACRMRRSPRDACSGADTAVGQLLRLRHGRVVLRLVAPPARPVRSRWASG